MIPKTPAFTTATACKRALTGVGATIAEGSQEWKGIQAAFMNPNIKQKKAICKVSLEVEPSAGVSIPWGAKSVVPTKK